jgi:hypothetical protein
VDSGGEKGFISIHIAYASNEGLVAEKGFYRRLALIQAR